MAVLTRSSIPHEKPATEPPPGVRILFVDDDADTAFAMSRLLAGCGHQVLTAGSVDEAVRTWSGGSFDLLISDIGLPDGTGRDILRAISVEQPVKAIVISGHGLDEDVQESRSAGFAEHLVKPISVKALQATIRRIAG